MMIRKRRQRQRFEQEALPHLPELYGMALRLTRNPGDAEDLVQDAAVRAYRFYDRFEAGSNIRAWLFKILTNTFYSRTRSARTRQRLEDAVEAAGHYDRFLSEATTDGKTPEESLLGKIEASELREALDELPEEFRVAVVLCDLYGFSYKEIADIIERPVGTVMSRLYRGRRLLQQRLYDFAQSRGYVVADRQNASVSASAEDAVQLEDYRRKRLGF